MVSQPGALQLFIDGVWTTVPLLAGQGTTVQRGLDPFADWPRPSEINTRINNDSLEYDPSRPQSTLYSKIGRNTRARWQLAGTSRLWAEASEWKPEATENHAPGVGKGSAWVDLTAAGILRRLGSWEEPLRSTMYRTESARPSQIGHWPLEDPASSPRLANTARSPATAGTYRGVTLGDDDAPFGAASSAVQSADGQMTGNFLPASSTAGWQIAFSMRLKALPASGSGSWTLFRWQTSNGDMWRWSTTDTAFQLSVTDSTGAVLFSNNTTFGTGATPTTWIRCRVGVNPVSGGTVSLNQAWYMQDLNTFYFVAPSYAGTSIGSLRRWWQESSALNDGSRFSHVLGLTGLTEDLMSVTSRNVFNGYNGELSNVRYNRILAEVGITRFTIGVAGDGQPMGPQPVATVMEILKEIVDTDACRIDDERFDIATTITTRRAMYNQAPALTLAYPSQVAPPFRKRIDDANVKNHITVKSSRGGEAVAIRTTGPMSTQVPPAGVGEKRGTVEVNATENAGQLDQLAAWHLARYTLDRPRYEEVTVDLLANPGLQASVFAVREGNMIRVTGYEPEPIDLLVVGIVDTAGKTELRVTFKCEPYEPYMIGVWNDPAAAPSRWDTATTTVAAAATSTATALQVTTTDRRDILTTNAASLPVELIVAGERVRATAITAAAGTGPYTQTLTVVRSINGVVKPQPIGGAVTVADSRRWGL